jgi:hypothetical protein
MTTQSREFYAAAHAAQADYNHALAAKMYRKAIRGAGSLALKKDLACYANECEAIARNSSR